MACFILCHFMNGVVDGVQAKFLCHLGNFQFPGACTFLCFHTCLYVGLGVPYNFSEQFSKFCGVLSFLKSIALECLSHFWITFTVCLTAHGEIHAHFGAFSHKVVFQSLQYKRALFTLRDGFCYADLMLAGKIESVGLFLQDEF